MAYQTYYIHAERVTGSYGKKLMRLMVYEPLDGHHETELCTALGAKVGRVMMRPMADRKLEATYWRKWSREEYQVIRAIYGENTPIYKHIWWHEVPAHDTMTPRWHVVNLDVEAI